MKSAQFALAITLVVIVGMATTPYVLAGPTTITLTELSNTQLNATWSGNSLLPPDLTVVNTAPDTWTVDLPTGFYTNGAEGAVWAEPDASGYLNGYSISSNPFENEILVTSDNAACLGCFLGDPNGATDSKSATFFGPGHFVGGFNVLFRFDDQAADPIPTPEPSTLSLIAVGLGGLGLRMRNRWSKGR